jgi:diaminopimelate epimerase
MEVEQVDFHRMSAAGNAFYLALDLAPAAIDAAALAQRVAAGRQLSALDASPPAGPSDGLILCTRPAGGSPRQQMFNPDGSSGHCANGLRCLAWLLARAGALPEDGTIDTVDGPVALAVSGARVEAALGPLRPLPGFAPPDTLTVIELDGEPLSGYAAFVGNPQFVLFGDAALQARVGELGPRLQRHPRFPDGVNVEFVVPAAAADEPWRVRVWERGVGETLACGTGALAVAAVGPQGIARGEARRLAYPGGLLTVRRDGADRLHLAGAVRYEGRYRLAALTASQTGEKEGGRA